VRPASASAAARQVRNNGSAGKRAARSWNTSTVSPKRPSIAEAAGVSRQLVYVHFANRAGLLVAVARHHDASSGFVERVAATRKLPALDGLEALLRLWLSYIPEILPVARALEAAATNGEEGGTAWRDRMDDLWEAFRVAVDRVHRDGRLGDRWTVRTATDWI
jgi:AcrR family transcriptional regulator